MSSFSRRIYFIYSILALFILATAVVLPNTAFAQTASTTYTGSYQNDIGDVIGPDSGGYTSGSILPIPGISTPSTAPSASTITSGITSGIFLQGLVGDSNQASTVSSILSAFDSLPPELQSQFLDAIMQPGLTSSEIMDIINDFNDLSTLHGLLDNVMCPGLADPGAFTAFAQNSLTSMINIDTPNILSGINLGSLTLSFSGIDGLLGSALGGICPDGSNPIAVDPVGGGVPGIDPLPTDGSGNPVPTVGSSSSAPAPNPGTDPVAGHIDCSSNWQNQKNNNYPPALAGDQQNIHSHIRAAAAELGMDPSTLAGIIWLESRGDPTASAGDTCSKCSATGLIQFINSTAQGLGMHGKMGRSEHMSRVKGMSVEQQMPYVIKYFKQAGWKAGMSDIQAYRTVHGGGPNSNLVDQATGKTTDDTFGYVLPKIEAYRCGRYDWNTLSWPP